MTSSLVGSEMCIRDSALLSRAQVERLWRQTCTTLSGCLLCQPRHTLPAVSYTHLTLPTICSV
eukprot:3626767-Prorocentrum_lima.AAC.1